MITYTALLFALAAVESGNNPAAIGRNGERSAYQISAAVWAEHATLSFEHATTNPTLARICTDVHLRSLAARLTKEGIEVSPRHLALAWKGGMGAVLHSAGNSNATRDFADRVCNIYWEELVRASRMNPAAAAATGGADNVQYSKADPASGWSYDGRGVWVPPISNTQPSTHGIPTP